LKQISSCASCFLDNKIRKDRHIQPVFPDFIIPDIDTRYSHSATNMDKVLFQIAAKLPHIGRVWEI